MFKIFVTFSWATLVISSYVLAQSVNIIIPKSITKAAKSTLRITFSINDINKNEGSCSATRISKNLILTAAHCISGFNGTSTFSNFHIKKETKNVFFTLIEKGNFNPKKGMLSDWAILKINQKDLNYFDDISIAKLANRQTIKKVIAWHLGDFANPQNLGIEVWSVTYPVTSNRMPLRPAPQNGEVFFSKGHLKSEDAYKKSILFWKKYQYVYDEIFTPRPVILKIDLNMEWQKLKTDSELQSIYNLWQKYKNDNNPLCYHSADFSQGSSGGGIFLKESGFLIAISAFKETLIDIKGGYTGINLAYRIDKICNESILLRKNKICIPDQL